MEVISWHEPGASDRFDPATIVRACIESGNRSLLLDRAAIAPEFFDLSTGVAGELLHRLGVYGIRLAAVVPDVSAHSKAFQEFVLETNRGKQYRFFGQRQEGIEWLKAVAEE